MTGSARPAGGLVSFLIGLVYLAALGLLSLGLYNYQVRALPDMLRQLVGIHPGPVEYRIAIDYNSLMEHQSRMIAQIETLGVPGIVDFSMPDYTYPGPLGIPVTTDAFFSMEYMAHVGFDLTEPESYSIELTQVDDSVSIRYAMPEPSVLALEVPQGAIESFFIETHWYVPAGVRLPMNAAMFPEAIEQAESLAAIEIEGDPSYFQQARDDLEAALTGYAGQVFEGRPLHVDVTFGVSPRSGRAGH